MGSSESTEKKAAAAEAPTTDVKAAAPAAAAATTTPAGEHPEKKRMSVMSKHLGEYLGESEEHKKQWMAHFGINAEGDIINKKKHDSAVGGFVGAVDENGNIIDKEKFSAACAAIKERGANKDKKKQQTQKGSKICVRNLPDDTTEDKMKELFASFGTVVKVDVKKHTEGKGAGKCKGYGFVQFSSAEEGSKAIAGMNDKQVGDKKLAVTHAFDSQEKGDGKGTGKEGKGTGKGKGKGNGKGNMTSQQYQAQADMQAYQQQVQQWYSYQYQASMMAQYQYQQQMAGYYAQANTTGESSSEVYEGEIKRVTAKNGYGFISCEKLKGMWKDEKNPDGRDIYISAAMIPESCKTPGSKIKFTLILNAKGHPQAATCEAA